MEKYNPYGCCTCCGDEISEGQLFFKVQEENFCQNCLCEVNDNVTLIPHIAANERTYCVFDGKTSEQGIYILANFNGHTLIETSLPDIRREQIVKYVDSDFAVLEKKTWGFMLHLPKSLIMETFRFNPAEKVITKLTEQLNIKYHLCLKYLCSEQHVVGIFSTATRQLRSLNDFCTFQPEYRICDKDFFEKLKNNPPISYKTAEALMQITPSVMLAYFSKRLIGQQHELKKIVYTFYEYLQNVAKDIPFTAPNWILTAPSGCGKTEVYRILRDFCKEYKIPIPVIQVDLTQYTEAGYKGKDLSDILKQIIEVNRSTDGTGICFLDEADKKFVPSIDSKGTDYNAALQANLLTFVEGNIQTVELDSDTNKYTFDTSKTMFVFMGSFQNIRDKKQSKHESKSVLGFGANIKKMERTNKVNDCFYDNITLEDMLEIGMLEELAGRLEQVINLHRIPEEDMLHLLREKTKMIAEEFGIDILMSENARKSFLEISYSSLGIRRPLYCIRSLVRNTLANAFFNEKFDISQYRVRILSYGNAKLQKKSLKRDYTKSV